MYKKVILSYFRHHLTKSQMLWDKKLRHILAIFHTNFDKISENCLTMLKLFYIIILTLFILIFMWQFSDTFDKNSYTLDIIRHILTISQTSFDNLLDTFYNFEIIQENIVTFFTQCFIYFFTFFRYAWHKFRHILKNSQSHYDKIETETF